MSTAGFGAGDRGKDKPGEGMIGEDVLVRPVDDAPHVAGAARPGVVDRDDLDPAELLAILRRVVGARMRGHPDAEDLVQETLARVLAASERIGAGTLEPYAIATARNLVTSVWREDDRFRRHQHRLVDLDTSEPPETDLMAVEDRAAMAAALARFAPEEQALLLAHEVDGTSTGDLAAEQHSTAGAVAAHLHRLRARLRVEYLLAREHLEPPTGQCRPVLLALSARDRRRQREHDAERHLLGCELCRRLRPVLESRGDTSEDEVRIPIHADADIVAARQAAREIASRVGLPRVDLTVLATAVSEMSRNIVRFAGTGEVVVDLIEEHGRRGVRVVARDAGPGIEDVEAALRDGYSTCQGLGLGLPGARRLMDEFDIASRPGVGTTVTMIKWHRGERI